MVGDGLHPEVPWSAQWETLDRFASGDHPALADALLGLVLHGLKTATCWPVEEGQQTEVGRRSVACDGSGRPRAVLETVSIERVAFAEVSREFGPRKEKEM